MRVTMYTGDYEPLSVVDLGDDNLRAVRRRLGPVTMALHEPLTFRTARDWEVPPTARTVQIELTVEGMTWADRRTRPILVAHGLCAADVPEGTHLLDFASEILRASLYRRDPGEVASSARNYTATEILARTRLTDVTRARIVSEAWGALDRVSERTRR